MIDEAISQSETSLELNLDGFSLVDGGPFNTVLRHAGLAAPDGLPTWRSAGAIALLAWLPPGALVVAQSLLENRFAGWEFFTDFTVYTRYVIAVFVLVAAERMADSRLLSLVRQFRDAGIIGKGNLHEFSSLLDRAGRQCRSWLPEAVIAVLVLAWSGYSEQLAVQQAGSSWDGAVQAGTVSLSWAGQASRFWSTPLFLFLALRWVWRFLIWSNLLVRVSRLRLQLTPLHPDGSAGLGFLAIYPSIFNGIIFSLSCVVASSVLKELSLQQHSEQSVWLALLVWLLFLLLLFLGPLLAFIRPLIEVREKAWLEYGRLASRHHLAFHRKWVSGNRDGAELMGSPDPSSVSDLNASVEAAQSIRVFPVNLFAVVQLLVVACLPLLAVVLKEIPLSELTKWLLSAIF